MPGSAEVVRHAADCRLPVRPEPEATALYGRAVEVPDQQIPLADPQTHTMGEALDAYARQRVPAALLRQACADGLAVEVHGIYPDHIPGIFPGAILAGRGAQFAGKRFNYIRPQCFLVPDGPAGRRGQTGGNGAGPPLGRNAAGAPHDWRLVIAVPPGRDYLLHYASLVRHCLRRSAFGGYPVPVIRYPAAEQAIAGWTQLDEFVEPGDRLLLGYVQELVPRLTAAGAVAAGTRDNEFYGSIRLRFPGSGACINAIGVRFSFWGDISARLAEACHRRGASEVVYAGKLGTFTAPSDVYRRIFIPSRYVSYRETARPQQARPGPANGLLARYPSLDSGAHMSVGTVLEEDLVQRTYADWLGVSTIDNEIAQMAEAIADCGCPGRTSFSAVHFATDHLRDPGKPADTSVHNLANNRRADALALKKHLLDQIAGLLRGYYEEEPVPAVITREAGPASRHPGRAENGSRR